MSPFGPQSFPIATPGAAAGAAAPPPIEAADPGATLGAVADLSGMMQPSSISEPPARTRNACFFSLFIGKTSRDEVVGEKRLEPPRATQNHSEPDDRRDLRGVLVDAEAGSARLAVVRKLRPAHVSRHRPRAGLRVQAAVEV